MLEEKPSLPRQSRRGLQKKKNKLRDAAWLKEMYYDNNLSMKQIAEIVGCAPGSVFNAMKEHGFSSRPVGNKWKIYKDGKRQCTGCKEEKPLSEFGLTVRRRPEPRCKSCKIAAHVKRYGKRLREDGALRLIQRLRSLLNFVIKRAATSKESSTLDLVGCDAETLKKHMERQFKKGMTWENYGKRWHVDHIIPVSHFDLSNPEEQRASFHFTNLRPLWAMENILKRDKRTLLV
jgi:transposase-like protein